MTKIWHTISTLDQHFSHIFLAVLGELFVQSMCPPILFEGS